MEFIGYIYQHNKNSKRMIIEEENFWIGFIACATCVVILDLNSDYWNLYWLNLLFKVLAFFFLIFAFWNRTSAMNKKEPLNGKLNGTLKINMERIEINKRSYCLKEISNLEIRINNFSGKLLGKPNYPGPWRSNGVGNSISFLSNGIKIEHRFSIQSEKDFETLKDIKGKINNSVSN